MSALEDRGARWHQKRFPNSRPCCRKAAGLGYAAGHRALQSRQARARRDLKQVQAALRERLEELDHG